MPDPSQKPRIALMGEFSAGKSTLTNLLLGSRPLPVKVTATRLPPVWISHGPEQAQVQMADGTVQDIAPAALDRVPLAQARRIDLQLPSEALELCDLIDMPGISDPNMPAEVWQTVLPEVDSVIWCTSATQAWRQSEAAFWSILSPQLKMPGTLMVTHFDKLTSERDRARVLRRLERETDGGFGAIFPIALPQALAAGEDVEAWKTSGADQFVEHLIDMLLNWETATASPPLCDDTIAQLAPVPDLQRPRLRPVRAVSAGVTPAEEDTAAEGTVRVLPRRVRSETQHATPRPRRGRQERRVK
ncbi:dynamin family protein [Epibacterium sp. Ofav1-8]|uniref:dynamin family protein n=1 Tax=Epibacterium sp. Ofav1-8 TaxID=2917735 RepID=UPI001EF52508|nr:dynamin family protein [Epibacterium sp. Ofav1-8]MCG7624442.1 dynamin family protein [Epibacterium sp. Ofav1-8]